MTGAFVPMIALFLNLPKNVHGTKNHTHEITVGYHFPFVQAADCLTTNLGGKIAFKSDTGECFCQHGPVLWSLSVPPSQRELRTWVFFSFIQRTALWCAHLFLFWLSAFCRLRQ